MSWDDVKVDNESVLTADEWNDHVQDQKSRAKVIYGSGSPTSIPEMIGAIYVDTTNNKKYIAIGTSSVDDWKEITSKEDFDGHINDSTIHFTQSDISISSSQINDWSTTDLNVNSLKSNKSIVFASEVSATATIDWTQGNKQSITLTADTTLTFTNPSGPTNLVLKVVQDSVGGHALTFPDNVKWEGGNVPDLSGDVGGAIRIVTMYFDGVDYYAQITDPYA